jgi:elongation factor 1-gamma
MKIYTDSNNPVAWKALVAANFNQVQIEVVNATEQTIKNSPFGKIPYLETSDGVISEGNAIARYVARQGKNALYGKSAFEVAQIEQWIDFSASEIDLPASVWVFPILGFIPNNAQATQKAKGDVRKVLEILNKHLQTRTFLVGQRISLADIVVAASLVRLFQRVLDNGFRKPFVNANRWFLTIVNQEEFKKVSGEVKLCEKMEVAPEAPAEEPKKEQAKKEQPKKEQPKKEEQKKEKPKKKEEEEEEDDDPERAEREAEKKKGPNPLDLLPPSTFIMDEWKRMYSNNDTRSVAIPWFWEKLDRQGYSIWFGEYKYNDELSKVFMTSNLLSGFIQRVEKLRKYGFGSLIIFGEEPSLEIGVCFLVRGQDLPAEMLECDDTEHYAWRKANLDNSADRELINDYWAWDGSFGGRAKKFNQGKAFK